MPAGRPLRSIRQTALAVPHRIEDVVDIRVERFHGFYCGCRLSVTVREGVHALERAVPQDELMPNRDDRV